MQVGPEGTPPPQQKALPSRRPPVRIWSIFLAIFIFEVGLVLLVLPWRDTWYLNYFRQSHPILENIWDRDWFRWALSGLGVVNVYISFLEFLRAFRRR